MPPLCSIRRGRLLFLAATLVAMTGCGVAGYEAKMKEEKERLAVFDTESSVLGPPLEEPVRDIKEKGEDSPGLFFRPPKGISQSFRRQPKDEGKRDRAFGDLLYIYPRTASETPISELLVAVYSDPKNELFRDLFKHPRLQGLTDAKDRNLEPMGRPPFKLGAKESGDVLFFFFQRDAHRAALVFLVEKGRLNEAKERIALSLRSLAVGPESAKLWNENRAQTSAKNSIQPSAASTQP